MPYVILDRDGVINYESPAYIKRPEEWHPIPGSLEAIAQLNRAGYSVLVATNQSGVARGYYDLAMLDRIHQKMLDSLAAVGGSIDEIFSCTHHPDDHCLCRKPNPGMLFKMKAKYLLDLTQTFFIGDSLVDVKASLAAGCTPLLVMTGNGKKTLLHHPELSNIAQFTNLAHAVEYIISTNKGIV